MRSDDCELAHRKLVQAFYLDGTLAIFATGHVPVPGYEVGIEPALPFGEPRQFSLLRRKLAGIYPHADTPYTLSRVFAVHSYPANIVMNHAEGRDVIDVADVMRDSAVMRSKPGDLPIPYVFPPSATRGPRADGVAVGYSSSFDIGEALRSAIAALPPPDAGSEVPQTVGIIEVGAEQGGIANFHHLFVRVKRQAS